MTTPALDTLINDTVAQLAEATAAVAATQPVDLSALPPRIELICQQAVAARDKAAAKRLAELDKQLSALEALLRDRIAASGAPTPDPRRAAELYRAADPASGERQP